MDLDGQDSAKGTGGEDRQVNNVLQFPRDWIGPTEELIPFGPRADRVAVDDPPELPSASDFWGEHAAAIHSVLEDPSVEAVPAEPIPARIAPAPSRDDVDTPARVRTPASWRGRIRAPLAWRVALGVAATLVLVVLALGEQGQPANTPARASVGFLASAGHRLTTSEGIVGAVRHEQSRAAAVMQRAPVVRRHLVSAHHRAAAAARSGSANAKTNASAATVAVHYSATSLSTTRPRVTYAAPLSTSASTAGTTVGTSSTSGTSGSGSGGTSRGSGSTGSSSSSAGPVGAGAPFGPGHLG